MMEDNLVQPGHGHPRSQSQNQAQARTQDIYLVHERNGVIIRS